MPTNTNGGTTTSLSNTPQATDDSYSLNEDTICYFDVMSDDLGGSAKVLWSIDDTTMDGTTGTTGTSDGTLDLTIKDAVGVCNYSDCGARMWITADGKVAYDTSVFTYLAAGETKVDHFTYAIRLANGTLSWATVSVTVTGTNDGPDIKLVSPDSDSASRSESDAGLTACGTLTVSDADTSDTVNVTVTGVSVGGTGGAGGLTNEQLLAMMSLTGNSNNAADGTQGSLGWKFDSGTEAFNNLAAGQTLVLTYTLTGSDGHTGGTDTQQVTITITGTNDVAVISEGAGADHAVVEAGGVANGTPGDPNASGTLLVSDLDDGEGHFVAAAAGDLNGTYGSFTFNAATGEWTYTLDNTRTATQALNAGDPATDTLTVRSADGTAYNVVVNITGSNDAAVITEAAGADHAVVEAGGIANGTAGDPSASGTLNVIDVDDGESAFQAAAPGDLNGTYGTFTFSAATGEWTYTLDNTRTATQALNAGDPATDTLTVHSADGTAYNVVVNITGSNDVAVITENAGADHDVVEAGGVANGTAGDPTASGTLNVTDVDDGESHFVAAASGDLDGTYGSFTFNEATGAWTYALNNGLAATQALNAGDPATDTLTVHSTDGTAYDVVVHITGTNDAAVITEAAAADHAVVEAGGVANGTAGDPSASGTLNVNDVDDGESSFQAAQPADLTGTYGGFTFDETTGAWTYTLNDGLATTQALNAGDPATDTLTVHSADGTAYNVVVNITGSNDNPTVTAALTSSADEGDTTYLLNLLQGASDVDDGETATLTVANVTYAVDGGMANATAPAGLSRSGSSLTVDPTNAAFDHLAENQTTTIVVSYDVTDVHGASVHQTETITITGTNDTPTVAAELTSDADEGDSAYNLNLLQGASDVDDGETATLTVANVLYAVDGGSASATAPAGLNRTGASLSVDPTNAAFDHLADGQTMTIVVSYDVTDVHGASVPQTETITITGTNDAPLIGTAVDSGSATEDTGVVSGQLRAIGSIGFTDVDLADTHSVSVSPHDSGYLGALNAIVTDDSTGDGTGQVNWRFAVDNNAVQGLAEGETIVQVYDVTVSDGHAGGTATQTVTVTITGTNDAPIVTTSGTLSYTENQAAAVINSALIVTDVDSDNLTGATVSISGNFASGEDVLGFVDQNGITGSYDSSTGVLTLSGTATVTEYEAALRSVTYTNSSENPSGATRTISFQVDDGSVLDHASNIATTTVSVTPVNDGPVATITPASYSATEQVDLNLHGTGLSISDVDSGSGSLTVTLSVTEGILNVGSGTTGAVVSDNGTSSVTVTGTLSQINALLAGSGGATVAYNDNTDTPAGSATLTLTVHDNGNTGGGDLSSSDTATINITAVNDGPVNTLPATFSTSEDTSVKLAGLSVSDPDSASGAISVTLSVGSGTLTASSGGNVTVSGSGTGSLVLSGSQADINAFLSSVSSQPTYVPASNFNGPVTLTMTTDDGGNTGGGALSDTDTSTITIAAVNDAPVASGSATLAAILEDDATPPGATVSSLFGGNFSDAADQVPGGSSANGFAGIAISSYTGDANKGSWEYSTDGGASWTTVDDTSSSSALTLNGTDLLRFVPAADYSGPATTLSANLIESGQSITSGATVDLTGATGGSTHISSGTVTLSETITAVNDAPIVDLNGGAAGTSTSINYTAGTAAVTIAPAGTVLDVDSANFDGGLLEVSFPGGGTAADQLTIFNQGTGAGQIGISGTDVTYGGVVIGSWSGGQNGSQLFVTLNASATQAAVTALVEDIRYSNATSGAATKTVNFLLMDGDGTENGGDDIGTATATINVAASNAAPTANADVIVISNNASNVFVPASWLLSNDHDPDGDALSITALSVVGSLPSNWTLTPVTSGGVVTGFNVTTSNAANESVSISYTISDGNGHTSTVTSLLQTPGDTSTNGSNTITLNGIEYNYSYIDAGNGNDTITGGSTTPVTLAGTVGNDAFVGGAGNDVLDASGGSNILTGNGGNDDFIIRNFSGMTNHITDFDPGTSTNNNSNQAVDQLHFDVGTTLNAFSVGNNNTTVDNFKLSSAGATNVAGSEVVVNNSTSFADSNAVQAYIDGHTNITQGAFFVVYNSALGHAGVYYDANPSTAGGAILVAEIDNITSASGLNNVNSGDFIFI